MFEFLKRHKGQAISEIPEPQQELKLSIRERALNVFSNIEGLDDIKEMMLRALESPERAHTLLVGPPNAILESLNISTVYPSFSKTVFKVKVTSGSSSTNKILLFFLFVLLILLLLSNKSNFHSPRRYLIIYTRRHFNFFYNMEK